jgi:beta-lactamase class A
MYEKILLRESTDAVMLTTSDNHCKAYRLTKAWQEKEQGINEILDSLGLVYTRVNSRTPGREDNRTQ